MIILSEYITKELQNHTGGSKTGSVFLLGARPHTREIIIHRLRRDGGCEECHRIRPQSFLRGLSVLSECETIPLAVCICKCFSYEEHDDSFIKNRDKFCKEYKGLSFGEITPRKIKFWQYKGSKITEVKVGYKTRKEVKKDNANKRKEESNKREGNDRGTVSPFDQRDDNH